MEQWRALNDGDIVDLAGRLRSLGGAPPMDTLPQLAAQFGWEVLDDDPEQALLDAGFGPFSGTVDASDDAIVDITLWVTDNATDDSAGQAWARDQFARMTAALCGEFGEPSKRIPGTPAETRWAGPENTLVLRNLRRSVELSLIANHWLELHDQAVALAEQESN